MPVTLYSVSIPVFIRGLNNLSAILKKGEQYADEKGIPQDKIINTRLAEDMAALAYQVQRVSDTAKGAAVRLGGVESVVMEDKETTFEELQARIQKTIDFLKSVDPKAFDGKDDAEMVLKTPSGEIPFTGGSYVLKWAIPNFFFHITTTYAILRHVGVPIGKFDYFGREK